jgi:8-oxo-dGTP diphosphatase
VTLCHVAWIVSRLSEATHPSSGASPGVPPGGPGRYGLRVMLALPQRMTGFGCVVDESDRILMVRHERLGVVRWELPGGHVDPGESTAEAAVRETREEALVDVAIDFAVAECRHVWRGKQVGIVYYLAHPAGPREPVREQVLEPGIHAVEWRRATDIHCEETSPLAWPVVDLVARRAHQRGRRLLFDATHTRTPAGWEPVVTRSWQMVAPCREP